MADDQDPKIGFRSPPPSRRFGEPGGNARGRGRQKGSRNVSTILEEVLSARITVKDGGKRPRKITKLDAGLTQLANRAATGDLRAIQMVLALAQGMESKRDGEIQRHEGRLLYFQQRDLFSRRAKEQEKIFCGRQSKDKSHGRGSGAKDPGLYFRVSLSAYR